jgi:hypothetical protein
MSGTMVDLIAVKSSSVKSIGYDEDLQALYVQFIEGEIYEYFNVPEDDFIGLMQATSIGWFVNKRIKPYYDYRKLDDGAIASSAAVDQALSIGERDPLRPVLKNSRKRDRPLPAGTSSFRSEKGPT